MLSKILGVIWVLLGLLWTIKPEMLKNRLKRKMSRRIRWVVFGFLLVFGLLMVGSVLKVPGILYKILGIVGMIIAIKAIMLITSKTSEKVFDWWGERPVIWFRVWGLIVLVMGIMLIVA